MKAKTGKTVFFYKKKGLTNEWRQSRRSRVTAVRVSAAASLWRKFLQTKPLFCQQASSHTGANLRCPHSDFHSRRSSIAFSSSLSISTTKAFIFSSITSSPSSLLFAFPDHSLSARCFYFFYQHLIRVISRFVFFTIICLFVQRNFQHLLVDGECNGCLFRGLCQALPSLSTPHETMRNLL